MLTKLRCLEKDCVILRTVYPEVPPHVKYRITDFGKTLIPILEALCDWVATTWESMRTQQKSVRCQQANGDVAFVFRMPFSRSLMYCIKPKAQTIAALDLGISGPAELGFGHRPYPFSSDHSGSVSQGQ